MKNTPKIEYPVRINRYLYLTGQCSRREADRLIEEGQIFVNNTPAVLGQKVNENDKVEVRFRAHKKLEKRLYIIFNKPVGVVSTNPQRDEKDFNSFGNFPKDIAPVGRLDKESHGLLLLTNDGRIVNKLLNPEFEHEKEYVVEVDKKLKENFVRKMVDGVNIEGYLTKPAKVKTLGERKFSIILTEGKKHQIRRMCAALDYTVTDLKRVRIMNIRLGDLKEGTSRELTADEKTELLQTLL